MTTLGGKTVARADQVRALQSDGGAYSGIGQVTNEDTVTPALIVNTNGTTPPSAAEFLTDAARLYPAAGNQTQYQNVNGSTDPSSSFVSCPPFPVPEAATVPAQGYACDDGNTVGGWVASSFTQPAIDSTVSVTFTDGSWLTGLTADPASGTEMYVTGGGIYRLTAVSGATATLKNLGIAAAIVSLTYT